MFVHETSSKLEKKLILSSASCLCVCLFFFFTSFISFLLLLALPGPNHSTGAGFVRVVTRLAWLVAPGVKWITLLRRKQMDVWLLFFARVVALSRERAGFSFPSVFLVLGRNCLPYNLPAAHAGQSLCTQTHSHKLYEKRCNWAFELNFRRLIVAQRGFFVLREAFAGGQYKEGII